MNDQRKRDDAPAIEIFAVKKPKISVIVPVYQAEHYLERCIRSILQQTYSNFELILVDDGSWDDSPRLCDVWATTDTRITTVHQENGGAAAARNTGLRMARGEFIAFVDSDDWIGRQMLERMLELQQRYNADMVLCGIKCNALEKEQAPRKTPRVETMDRKDCLDRFFRVKGEKADPHSVCGALISAKMLKGFTFMEERMNEDVHACFFLSESCRLAVRTDEVFYYYPKNINGVTNCSFNKKKLDLLYVWDTVYQLVLKYTPEYEYVCRMNCMRARFTLLSRMCVDGYDHSDKQMQTIRRQLVKEVRSSYWELIRWKMPLSRKVLLCVLVLPFVAENF